VTFDPLDRCSERALSVSLSLFRRYRLVMNMVFCVSLYKDK